MGSLATNVKELIPARRLSQGRRILLGNMALIGILTLAVKGVAFLKDLVSAARFGVSSEMDGFLLAFSVPAMAAAVFAAGVPVALVPAHAVAVRSGGEKEADQLAVNTLWCFGSFLAAFMAVLAALAGPVAGWLDHDAPAHEIARVASLLRALAPFGWFLGLSHVFAGLLQAKQRFFAGNIAPALVPLAGLLALAFGPESWGVWALVGGTVAGSFILFAVLGVCASRASKVSLWRPTALDASFKQLAGDSLPLVLGSVFFLGIPVVDAVMAARLDAGSVAAISYADKACSLFTTFIAAAIGKVMLPQMAGIAASADWPGLRRSLLRWTGVVGALSLPVVLVLLVSAQLVVHLLFERGSFTAADTQHVASVLRFYGFQIPFCLTVLVATNAVLCLRGGRFMLVATLVALAANVGLNWLFMQWWGARGIALSTSAVQLVSALLLTGWALTEINRRIRTA